VQEEGERKKEAERGVDPSRSLSQRLAREDLHEVAREDERHSDDRKGQARPPALAFAALELRKRVAPQQQPHGEHRDRSHENVGRQDTRLPGMSQARVGIGAREKVLHHPVNDAARADEAEPHADGPGFPGLHGAF